METFGQYIRQLREDNNMPLRKLAAYLDIDQSTLSKIERNDRQPTKEMVPIIADVFNLDYKQLKIKFLSEKITYELADEDYGVEALKVAEKQMKYLKNQEVNGI
jgi:transcriptional regulator with XRE-family HTH domain